MSKNKEKTQVSTTKKNLPELYDIGNEVRDVVVNISEELQSQISYCHHHVKAKEWSGVLIYTFNEKEGLKDLYDITNKKPFEVTAHKFLLRDIGSSALTEFDCSMEELMEQGEYMEKGYRLGLIHTHHSMDTYFSGTDQEELKTNAPNHEVYLSLIVNYAEGGQPCARLAWKGTREVEKKIKYSFLFGNKSKKINRTVNEDIDVVFFKDTAINYEVDASLAEKFKELKAKSAPKKSLTTKESNNFISNLFDMNIIGDLSTDQIAVLKNYCQSAMGGRAFTVNCNRFRLNEFLGKWASQDPSDERGYFVISNNAITDGHLTKMEKSFERFYTEHRNGNTTTFYEEDLFFLCALWEMLNSPMLSSKKMSPDIVILIENMILDVCDDMQLLDLIEYNPLDLNGDLREQEMNYYNQSFELVD